MSYKTMLAAAMGAALMTVAAGNADAATKFWTGGGSDNNLSTAANWSDGTAPASGDALVFAGNVRTTPYNDYDPDTTSFASLVFSNTCATTETSAAFTLSGNRIVLAPSSSSFGQRAVAMAHVPNTNNALTDVIACDVTLKNFGYFGLSNAYRHHLRFTGTVTAASAMDIHTGQQMKSTLTFEGPVKNFSRVQRPNGGGGEVYLKSSENVFSSAPPAHLICEGTLRVDSVAAAGGEACTFEFGQTAYTTPGIFRVNASENTTWTGAIKANSPTYTPQSNAGAQLYNDVAGTTATFSGDLTCGKTDTWDQGGKKIPTLGTAVLFGGVGDGEFSGRVLTDFSWLYKTDSGTWTFSGTSSATGAVTVVAGTLCVNGDYSTAQRSVVKAGAALGGMGKLGDVTFNGDALLVVVDFENPLAVTTLNLAGTAKLKAPGAVTAGTYTLLKYTAQTGTGAFILADGWPSGTMVTLGETALTVTVPASVLAWTGAASTAWDYVTANWADGALFSDGLGVTFDDTATRTDVVLAGTMKPTAVAVSGVKNYSISGTGLAGSMALDKSGTGVLTLGGSHSYTGDTRVNGGVLVLEGSLAGTSIRVASGAALTNAASSRLTGPGVIEASGPVELDGVNEMTGGLILNAGGVVKNVSALGAGDVSIARYSTVTINASGSCGSGKTLSSRAEGQLFKVGASQSFTWLGDVSITDYRFCLYADGWGTSGANVTFGEPGGSTVIRDGNSIHQGVYMRGGGSYHFYSRLDLTGAFEQTDGNTIHLYASGNTWQKLKIAVGKVVCHAGNVLAPAAVVDMCQVWENNSFNPVLDLNGYDQTISGLTIDTGSKDVSSQTIKSETPATLTVKNDSDTTTPRMQCVITNAVTLRKEGAGTWTFGARNATTGNVEVVEGTLALTAADSLPTGRYSTLFVTPGAKVSVSDGVNVTVPYLVYNGKHLPRGVYCGTGGAGTVNTDIFADGTGTLTVSRGHGGALLIIR